MRLIDKVYVKLYLDVMGLLEFFIVELLLFYFIFIVMEKYVFSIVYV